MAILLHWAIAVLIIANILLAWRMNGAPPGPSQFALFQLHKSIGITVLLLTLVRIGWRIGHRPPPAPPGIAAWQLAAARITHWGFYGLMLGLPLSGWALVSASPLGIPTLLYDVITWPHIGPLHSLGFEQRKQAAEVAETVHGLLAWVAYLLIALHVAGALKHHFVERLPFLNRMWPGRSQHPAQGQDR